MSINKQQQKLEMLFIITIINLKIKSGNCFKFNNNFINITIGKMLMGDKGDIELKSQTIVFLS